MKSRSSKGGTSENFNEIRFEDLKGQEQIYIHAEKNQDNIVENDETTNVGNDRTENVEHDEKITIGNDRTESVGKNEKITIGKNRTEDVGENETVSIGKNRNHDVGTDDTLNVGKNLTMVAGDMITLQTGAASIVMKKNGDITIKGKNITVQGSGKINATASSTVTIKGSKVLTN
jgi:type VI secretion system secreted protein VgrG